MGLFDNNITTQVLNVTMQFPARYLPGNVKVITRKVRSIKNELISINYKF